jgi:hypothetical protein
MKRLLLLLALAVAAPASAQVAVIVHPGSSTATINAADARNLFTLETTRLGGQSVTPVVLESGVDPFYGWIDRSFSDLRKLWLRKKLSGEGTPPETLPSPAAVVALVAATPDAIGYVPASAVTGSVKVIATVK